MLNFMTHHVKQNSVNSFVRCYSLSRPSHYEVLNLRKTCTDKDIKAAFIKLSKKFHPDKNKDKNAQQHFVRIVEAYNVLSKPSSRAQYDRTTHIDSSSHYHRCYNAYYNMSKSAPPGAGFTYNSYYSYGRTQTNTSSNANTYARQENTQSTYYGGLGIKRVPLYVLVVVCFGIAFIGTFLQIVVIREMYSINKNAMMERTKRLSKEYDKVRDAAQGLTNEEISLKMFDGIASAAAASVSKRKTNSTENDEKAATDETQTRLLLEKIVASANPTIATASLGQDLAGDKNDTLIGEPTVSATILSEIGISDILHCLYTPETQKQEDFLYVDLFDKLSKLYFYDNWRRPSS